jgi:DDE family transposase
MIFADALPTVKTFLRPARLAASTCDLLIRFVAASLCHPGRLSCSQAAQAIRSQARHRAQLARFLARDRWAKDWAVLQAVADLLLAQEAQRDGTWLFLLDQTHVGQQGQHTENTFSRGNYRKRPTKSQRKQKKHARRSCHCFVCGLLITPSGLRIPSCRCYYTRDYCKAQGRTYHKQPALAAALIREVAVPAGARVVVLGDTAFEAKDIRAACGVRGFSWVVPLNPERVLQGVKPRPKVRSLCDHLSAEHYEVVRLVPGQGAYAAHQRAARCRVGRQAKARTFWVHPERRAVHNVGEVLLVFSTKEQPQAGQAVRVQKVLMTDGVQWTAAEVVALYAVRWQVELFFKELKGTLGLHQYRFRRFGAVAGWVQACLVTFCYLEWFRAQQVARPALPEKAKAWWRAQRSYGLSRIVLQRAEEHDLAKLLRWSGTKSGLRKLRRGLRQALPKEYREAS